MTEQQTTVTEDIEREVRQAAHDLTMQIVEYFNREERPINEIIIVPFTIVARMVRTHDAIKLLLNNNHPCEAAVLALTQFELRLDLAYTALDVKKASEWLGHTDKKWSLRSVTDKLDVLFGGSDTRARMTSIFQHLSGIKHGNPVYSELGFPVRVVGRTVSLSTGDIDDDFSRRFKETLFAYATYQLAWASQVINKFVAGYAVIDKQLRLDTTARHQSLERVEPEFLAFLESINRERQGHLDLKKYVRKKPS